MLSVILKHILGSKTSVGRLYTQNFESHFSEFLPQLCYLLRNMHNSKIRTGLCCLSGRGMRTLKLNNSVPSSGEKEGSDRYNKSTGSEDVIFTNWCSSCRFVVSFGLPFLLKKANDKKCILMNRLYYTFYHKISLAYFALLNTY